MIFHGHLRIILESGQNKILCMLDVSDNYLGDQNKMTGYALSVHFPHTASDVLEKATFRPVHTIKRKINRN